LISFTSANSVHTPTYNYGGKGGGEGGFRNAETRTEGRWVKRYMGRGGRRVESQGDVRVMREKKGETGVY
jgi:hypothetical protein